MREPRKLNILSLSEVEQEIEMMMSITDDPSEELIEEVTQLIRVARSLGSTREW
jgi:hypothetical protein